MGIFDKYDLVELGTPGVTPPIAPVSDPAAPSPSKSIFDAYPLVKLPATAVPTAPPPTQATGLGENFRLGIESSSMGLAWRGQLPSLFGKEHETFWNGLARGVGGLVGDIVPMTVGAIAGGIAGGAAGSAFPGAGSFAGGLLGSGAGMNALPTAITESLLNAYKSGEITTKQQWWEAVQKSALNVLKAAGVGAATMGAIGTAGRITGRAIAPAIGESLAVPVAKAGEKAAQFGGATAALTAAETAAVIAAFPTIPALLDARLPDWDEIGHSAIIVGGAKGAHAAASRILNTFRMTGRPPAEIVAAAKADQTIAEDLVRPKGEPTYSPLPAGEQLRSQMFLFHPEPREGGAAQPESRAPAREAPQPVATPSAPEPFNPELAPRITELATARLAELETKAKAAPAQMGTRPDGTPFEVVPAKQPEILTDLERAERVFLTNNLGRPDVIAKHYDIVEPITRETHDASAQRVYDDFLGQLRTANEARRSAGLTPLDDTNMEAAARIAQRESATFGAMHGRLPWDIYQERYPAVRDATQRQDVEDKIAAVHEAEAAGAEVITPAERDLFGEQIQIVNRALDSLEAMAVVEVPLDQIKPSAEVPQFKRGGDAEGVVEPLGGKFDRTDSGAVQLWERLNGRLELISGRHRTSLARRSGETSIPAQIHREADGFDVRQAIMLDAIINIRDEKGTVADYAHFFRSSAFTREEALAKGLLARSKGRDGFAIARDASPNLLGSLSNGDISPEAALAISATAPRNERLQDLGMAALLGAKPFKTSNNLLVTRNLMKLFEAESAARVARGQQGDMFGFDADEMQEAVAISNAAAARQSAIRKQLSVAVAPLKNPQLARDMGIDVRDEAATKAKVVALKEEQYKWDNYATDVDLMKTLRARDLNQDAPPTGADTPAFKAWFGESKVVDEGGKPLVVYHGSNEDITTFERTKTVDGGFHFGTAEQSRVRLSGIKNKNQIAVYLNIENPRRSKDEGGNWIGKIASAKSAGHDGIVYLNRFEGVSLDSVKRLQASGKDVDRMSDAEFKKFAPEAQDSYIAFRDTQIKSTGNRGTYDPKNPNILFQDEYSLAPDTPAEAKARDAEAVAQARRKLAQEAAGLKGPLPTVDQADLFNTQGTLFQNPRDLVGDVFYSELGKQIDAATMKAAPANGWKEYLRGLGSKGVKPDEIRWSGIEDWLDTQQGRVSKEQVQAFLKGGGVQVQEHALGEPRKPGELPDGYEIKQFGQDFGLAEPNGQLIAAGYSSRQQLLADLDNILQTRDTPNPDGTKYGGYQTAGGTNYRERVLTLPAPQSLWIVVPHPEGKGFAIQKPDGSYLVAGPDRARPGATLMWDNRKDAERYGMPAHGDAFHSSHWPQPNPIAHFRTSDYVDADGKRVLMVQEVQSDWAQKGRKEGFANQELKIEANTGEHSDSRPWRVGDTLFASRDNAEVFLANERRPSVPSAPFVENTSAWTSLVLKRIISLAAQEGYDKVAWTTGEQQVGFYTNALRKAVDTLHWEKTEKGVHIIGYKDSGIPVGRPQDDGAGGMVRPTRPGGEPIKVVDTRHKEDELSDSIGKAMAKRIIDDPAQSGTIEGENINVDDPGMAGFYDRMLPNIANKVLKQLGGGRVGELRIGKDQSVPADRVEELPNLDGSGTHFIAYGPDGYRTGAAFDARADAERAAGATEQTTQPGFEITPALRERASHALPLFQRQNQDPHLGSYKVSERLITLFENANSSTVVHELGHHFMENLKYWAEKPNAPARVLDMWETARREFAIGEKEPISQASHEQAARSFERYLGEGVAPSIGLRAVFDSFKRWMLEVYNDLRNLDVTINPEIRSLFDRMLATDQEIADARVLDVPRAYVAEARAGAAERIVPPADPRRKIEPGFAAEQASMEPYADALPPGPGEAPDNIHVNYAYINTPTDVKLAMQRMAEIDQANIQRQRGGTDGVKSWAQANEEQARYLNDILGGGEDTLKLFQPRDPDAAHVDVRLGILKKLAVGAAQDSARLRDVVLNAGHDATVRQQLEYMGSIERARMIQAEFLGERASVARALNALKDLTEGSGEIGRMLEAIGLGDEATLYQAARTPEQEQAYLRAELDRIMVNYRGRTPLDIARLHKEIGTLKGTFKLVKTIDEATTWEKLVEGWRSGLLSGPVTHTTNLFGTGAFQVMRAPVDALASVIGMARGASVGMGETDRASMSEAVARLTGMIGGIQDGVKVGFHTFMADEAAAKAEQHRQAIPGQFGRIVRIPLRLMGAEDAMVSTMYRRGELRTLAIRQAFDENMNPSTRQFAQRVDHLVDHPTEDMTAIADQAATRMTFNADLGEKGVALQTFVGKWHLQWMIPFIRTPINIAKELARMSPAAPLVGEWRAAMRQGGVERDRALAEVALGTGLMALTMAYTFSGNISGAGSPDPGKNRAKAGVWQPYSRLIGDTWYEYARIQPQGTLMGMAADIATIWDHLDDENRDKIPKMLAVAFSNAVTNQTFLQGITNVIRAMDEPARFGPKFAQQLAASMVPNVIGQPTTMADPVVRQVDSMLQAVQARIPGMRQQLPAKIDWLGEEVQTKERMGVVLPVREQRVSEDKVRLEADRMELSVAAAPKKTHIGKGTGKLGDVELTPEERHKFEVVGGQFAHKILTNIVNAPGYDEIPDMIKRRIFSKVLTASHRMAAIAALPPDKRQAYITSISERVQSELAPEPTQ